jgi:hypothetical protein
MSGLREFFAKPAGQIVGIVGSLGLIVLMVFVVKNTFTSAAEAASTDRVFICAETGKPFKHSIEIGDRNPIESPYSGKRSGYPAELCFWTADGKTKKEPTYVLLKSYKGDKGPTFCPDCGRLVVGLNPAPSGSPPPTEAEYNKSRGTR